MLEVIESIPYKGIRRIIGKRMEISNATPQSYQGLYADVTDLIALRKELNDIYIQFFQKTVCFHCSSDEVCF